MFRDQGVDSTSNLPMSADQAGDAHKPASADGRLVSEAEYWQDGYDAGDVSYEWNNGRLEEKPVSDFETFQVYLWFLELLRHYLRLRPIGKLVALEMGFRLALKSGTVIRKPDLAVVLDDNPVPLTLHDSSYHGVFELCVEAPSTETPADVHRDLVVKKAEYAAGGVPERFVLHRQHGNLVFFGRTPGGVYAPLPVRGSGDDRLVGSRVLPGFKAMAGNNHTAMAAGCSVAFARWQCAYSCSMVALSRQRRRAKRQARRYVC
jgi:Uma2 family endonuclease